MKESYGAIQRKVCITTKHANNEEPTIKLTDDIFIEFMQQITHRYSGIHVVLVAARECGVT